MLNRIGLVAVPLLIMFFVAIINGSNLTRGTTIQFQSQNITANQYTGSFQTGNINIPSLLSIAVIISVALSLCIVMGINVLGSGISGSVIPIVFMVTILSGVFFVLSGLSYSTFMDIPVFGLPLYFGLVISYIIGIGSLAIGGGD